MSNLQQPVYSNAQIWWKKYKQLTRRIDNQEAAIAIARKLLVIVWNALTKQEADYEAKSEAVGASLMKWTTNHRIAMSLGMKSAEFTGRQLSRLGIRLEKVKYCTRVYPIPIIPDG